MDNSPAHTPRKKWGAMDSRSGSIVTHTTDQILSKGFFLSKEQSPTASI